MIENQGLDRSNSMLQERAQLSDRLWCPSANELRCRLSSAESLQDAESCEFETLGEVRKNKLAAVNARSVL